ncbi:MAG: hypothetical protein ACK4PI_10380 [Tepidisphaerales bacterium]
MSVPYGKFTSWHGVCTCPAMAHELTRSGRGRGEAGPAAATPTWGGRLVDMARWVAAMPRPERGEQRVAAAGGGAAGSRGADGPAGAAAELDARFRGTQAESLARWARRVRESEGGRA